MIKKSPLQGMGVLITRPKAQAEKLGKLIEAAGGRAILFPTLLINKTSHPETARQSLKLIPSCDWLFFTSANAVHHAAKLLNGQFNLSQNSQIAAIGNATKEALQQYNLTAQLTPSNNSQSEALLSQIEMRNMHKKKCMIIRGEGGRKTIAQALCAAGATVYHAKVYRRDCPKSDTAALITSWKNGEIDYVITTSGETLTNLIALLGECNLKLLTQTPLLTVSKRIEKMAYNAGIERVIISKQPYNETLIKALIEQTG